MNQGTKSFPIGTKVRVVGFPASQSLPFSFNGLVGEVRYAEKVGSGIGDRPVYQYPVHFENVEILYATLNPETNRLDRGFKIGSAENFFEGDYLEAAQ
jgi:hypothetical protein